jgi:D-3-phosphoglycerate dehydrogenase / 2-oxoglutarate reductase
MSRFKVYVTDYEYETLQNEETEIAKLDADFFHLQCRTEEDVIRLAENADALLVQYGPITAKVFDALHNLKIVVRYGVGVDCVDLDAATKHNVPVCNVPDYGVEEVSTHAVSMILACVRKIVLLSNSVKAGKWDYKISKPIHRTSCLTLGIAGFGRIPRVVAKKAAAFSFRILAYDPYIDDKVMQEYGAKKVDFDTLVKESDVVSIHVPLKKDTFHLFNKQTFSKMKRSAFLINTSRGPLVDEEALVSALEQKNLAGAAFDVCEKEPLPEKSRLREFDNVILTPHAAWYSEEAQNDLQRKAAEEVVRVLRNGKPRNCINIHT